MGGYAWVTLATNNSYSLGALVLAHSLKKANTAHKLAVLITPAVSESMREQLQTVFDVVKVVDVLDSKDEAHLALMKRPDLGITFTKIHCWRLVEFEKCVFLDADTLVVRNCDELFEREEFSAAPDVSWPDCFNSGVFVYRPSVETFNKLLQFAVENRSFDGGDQGLLNQFFSEWATEDIKKHLPFVYNLTSIAAYSYIPAFKHYGSETRIVHFIGTGKPWLQQLDATTRTVTPTSGSEHLAPLLQQWWDLFCEKVHPNLDKNLESSNDGMPQPPVEACSNSLAIALTDEPQTSRLIEPCTPYREKDDFRQYNLPYQPFDVKGSSGELLNVEFLLASVPPEEEFMEESSIEEPKREEVKMEEVTDSKSEEEKPKEPDDEAENKSQATEEQRQEEVDSKPEELEEEKKIEDVQQNQQEEPPPPKDPFDYNSFFPDETCVSNYLEQNIVTYQPFENHHHHHHQDAKEERESEQEVPPLPRFLTIPENDRRQSGNVEANAREEGEPPKNEPPRDPLPAQSSPPHREASPPPREEPFVEKRELAKSKSMPYLHVDATATETETPPRQSIWKSQPNVSVDPNKKYSMPKLKPILPKQNSFSKSVPSAMPKITLYTEFLMSSEYKDPVNLPKDKVGFVESHIHREAKLRRCKSDADIRSKFGPLPYALSPEVEKPVIPKKFPPRNLDNELYDLAQCKRQMGNKPKPKDSDRKKENVRPLPALRPIATVKDKKSTLIKKRKSKELSPGDGGREKLLKREPKIARERKRETKLVPRNVSSSANGNSLDEILQRLREFSKDYQHFFGVTTEPKRKTIKCKNVAVQAREEDEAEIRASEIFESVSATVSTISRETQTSKEANAAEFRQFRNYVKGKRETSQKGLLGIQDILSETHNNQPGTEGEGHSEPGNWIVPTEVSSLQRVDSTPLHSTDTKSQSRLEDGTASGERKKENSNSIDITSAVEDRNISEESLRPGEVESKQSEISVIISEDSTSKGQTAGTIQMQSAEPEVKTSSPEEGTSTEQNLSPAEILSRVCETNMSLSEESKSKEQNLRSPEMQSREDEVNVLTLEDPNSKEKSSKYAELESKGPEVNIPMVKDTNSSEFSLNPAEDSSSRELDLNSSEMQSVESEAQKTALEDHNNKEQKLISTENKTKEPEIQTLILKDFNNPELNLNSVEKQPSESEEKIATSKDFNNKEQNLNSPEIQSPEFEVQTAVLGELGSNEQNSTSIGPRSKESEMNALALKGKERGLTPPETHLKESERNILISEDDNIKEQILNSAEVQEAAADDNNTEKILRYAEEQSDECQINFTDSHSRHEIPNGLLECNEGDSTDNATPEAIEDITNNGEMDNNLSDSNAVIETLEKGNQSHDISEVALNSSLQPEENDTKESSRKYGEQQERHNSVEPKIATEKRGSSEKVAAESAPLTTLVASSPVITHNGHKSPPKQSQEGPQQKEKEKPANGVDTPQNPNEILCVPDFETPRSSRVGLPTTKTAATEDVEGCHPTAGNGHDSEANEFGDSPEGPRRFLGKNKSGREPPSPSPKPSTPVCGNPQTGSSEDLKRGSGIAGAIAQLSLEAGSETPESAAASAAHQEYLRRQNWETGNMDYMGRDSFDNIWSKICQTLEAKEAEEAAAESPKVITAEEKKPEANVPTEDPVSLSTILQKCPEYIETLPGDPAAGPVEDDEIIFSKPDNRQSCLTNIVEDEGVRREGSEAAGIVKLSDILQSGTAVGGEKIPGTTGGGEIKSVPDKKAEEPLSSGEGICDATKSQEVAVAAVETAQRPAAPAGEKAEPPTQATEEKSQIPAVPSEEKLQPVEEKCQSPAASTGEKPQPVVPADAKPPELPPIENKGPVVSPASQMPQTQNAPEPEKKVVECTTVAIPSPPIVFPGAPFAEKDKLGDKSKKSEDRPEAVSEPIPLPPPESPTLASTTKEPTTKTTEADSVKEEGKQKKGVFTKILEMVGVTPKEKNGSETSKSVFYDVEGSTEEAKEIEQASEVTVKSKGDVGETKKSDPEESSAAEELPRSKTEEATKTETVAESKAEVKAQDGTPLPEKQDGEKKESEAAMAKPPRTAPEGKKSSDSIQVSSPRKSPSPKLTMPEKPPETAITTPTPPPQPDVPPRKNSGLLKVDETILETPPVTDASKEGVVEAIKGKVDDIIGKAKSEVESLLQDRRSSEKEAGEGADLINTMKLMMGGEQAEKAAPEEVEELRVTSEEERRRHKGEVVSSKLSDQILKAIPPPRRKAISEASASTSAIPKAATAAPEQKGPPGEGKAKPSKPSSIPVPPPRSRGKPSQPSPPKGKGKK